jgi:hypothetical protein
MGENAYQFGDVKEISFVGGTVDTGRRVFLSCDDLSKMLYYGEPLTEEQKSEFVNFARIENHEPGRENIQSKELSKRGIALPIEKYVHIDRSLKGREFVKLPKNPETGHYRWVEVSIFLQDIGRLFETPF